jgi:CheY-like chemotaxis protein
MDKKLSVLIVDDNPSAAISLADVLKVKGFATYAASSGKQALTILEEQPVDLLLTDVIMPEMNGLELYQLTREKHPRVNTWFMTAYAADELIQQGIQEGIKIVLNKPLDMDLLFSFLNAFSKNVIGL